MIKIVCSNEPDISYSRNKPLIKNVQYLGEYTEIKLDKYGICPLYKVYDKDKNYLGEYYARDFKTVEENRNDILNELLEI